jgi:hypothetical protein
MRIIGPISVMAAAVAITATLIPSSTEARSRQTRLACSYITPANAARCCASTARRRTNPYLAYNCAFAYGPDYRSFGTGRSFGGKGGISPPSGGGGGGVASNLNPAGHPVPGIGVGILAPNAGGPGPGPGFGPTGNPGLGGNGPPGQSK